MIRPVTLSTVKVRPTDRKIQKSVAAAQRCAENVKREAPMDSKAMISGIIDVIKFVRTNITHKPN